MKIKLFLIALLSTASLYSSEEPASREAITDNTGHTWYKEDRWQYPDCLISPFSPWPSACLFAVCCSWLPCCKQPQEDQGQQSQSN